MASALIVDDTMQVKTWTDESEPMCWHVDHCSGRMVKGIKLLNAVYHCKGASIPVAFVLVKKPLQYCDLQTRQSKCNSEVTKNERMRQMIQACLHKGLAFRFDLRGSWYQAQTSHQHIAQCLC